MTDLGGVLHLRVALTTTRPRTRADRLGRSERADRVTGWTASDAIRAACRIRRPEVDQLR